MYYPAIHSLTGLSAACLRKKNWAECPLWEVWHNPAWFYFYFDSNNTSYRKEQNCEKKKIIHLERPTCLKLSQWCVFQRPRRTAGISLFRQIAVRVHQWNVDGAGSEPECSRPTAAIRRNLMSSQSSEEGLVKWPVETGWKQVKRVNTDSQTSGGAGRLAMQRRTLYSNSVRRRHLIMGSIHRAASVFSRKTSHRVSVQTSFLHPYQSHDGMTLENITICTYLTYLGDVLSTECVICYWGCVGWVDLHSGVCDPWHRDWFCFHLQLNLCIKNSSCQQFWSMSPSPINSH